MPPPTHSRAQNVWHWTPDELALILLRQFKRLLADHGADLTDAQLKDLAARTAAKTVNEGDAAVTAALRAIVTESEAVLASLGLTFVQSLDTEMTDLPGWDSTADFLTLANEKVNAELRISAGAALLSLLGDHTHARYLLASIAHGAGDPDDVDAVIALRSLAFAASIDPRAADAIPRLIAWVEKM